MYLVIDRFEENIAVCDEIETEKRCLINIEQIEGIPREGDVIREIEDGYAVDADKTNERKARIIELLNDLFG